MKKENGSLIGNRMPEKDGLKKTGEKKGDSRRIFSSRRRRQLRMLELYYNNLWE